MSHRQLSAVGAGLLVVNLVSACGKAERADARTSDIVDAIAVPSLERTLHLFIVDDSQAPTSQELRSKFADELASDVGEPLNDCDLTDPAAWAPADRLAMVVYPSLDTRLWVTPDTVPDLSLRTDRKTPGHLKRWATALAAAIATVPDGPRGSFAPLARLIDTISLLGGLREPADTAEQNLLIAAQGVTRVEVSLVSAVDDESADDPENYVLPMAVGNLESVVMADVVVPSVAGGHCRGPRQYSERFRTWLRTLEGVSAYAWASGDTCQLRSHLSVSCEARCFTEAPLIDETGRAACRVYAETTDSCPDELGWKEASEASNPELPSTDLDGARAQFSARWRGAARRARRPAAS
jgi:hypothetical protein